MVQFWTTNSSKFMNVSQRKLLNNTSITRRHMTACDPDLLRWLPLEISFCCLLHAPPSVTFRTEFHIRQTQTPENAKVELLMDNQEVLHPGADMLGLFLSCWPKYTTCKGNSRMKSSILMPETLIRMIRLYCLDAVALQKVGRRPGSIAIAIAG